MPARYDIELGPDGWAVVDTLAGFPVEVNGFLQIGLALEDADDLADLLNRLEPRAGDAIN